MRLFSFGSKKRIRRTRIAQDKMPGARYERRSSTNVKETLLNPRVPSIQHARWRFVSAFILVVATAVGWTVLLSWYPKHPQRLIGDIMIHIATKL